MTDIPGLPARRAALHLLDAVLRRGQPLESALAAATRGIEKAEDRALAHAIASETLRRLPDLDDLIDGATRQRLPDDAKARLVLRIALTQALILKTPEHAAVATALPLVEGGPRRLVHGVLGTLLRQKAQLRTVPMLLPAVEMRWEKAWGMTMVGLAAEALSTPPAVDVTLRDAAETEQWVTALEGSSLAPGHVRLPGDRAITSLPGFEEGAWWVQNLSASIPARLLGAGEGRSVLDLCAAPGGKTMQLAAQGWDVTAVDSHPARLERLKENLTRTRLEAQLVKGDLLHWQPKEPVDAILLDAPCTATGIFARHPDVLHRVRPKDIAQLAETQKAMLARVAGWLKPGGTLIYATCSLEPEEGEGVAATADSAGLTLEPVTDQQLVGPIRSNPKGWVRIYPQFGCDGFFIARFRRG
ncbi:MAG TPA: RsmB/NOP family class I SAM-dependent RNA methyltransferase, partial [Chakrabartia sp.]|nr:RsmB/NOP family class I SAM-dependent RNA methyltransferase [Chakrabartia sp.]